MRTQWERGIYTPGPGMPTGPRFGMSSLQTIWGVLLRVVPVVLLFPAGEEIFTHLGLRAGFPESCRVWGLPIAEASVLTMEALYFFMGHWDPTYPTQKFNS